MWPTTRQYRPLTPLAPAPKPAPKPPEEPKPLPWTPEELRAMYDDNEHQE